MTLDPELAHLLEKRSGGGRYFLDFLIPEGETEELEEGQWVTVLAPLELQGTLDMSKGRVRIIQQ